MRSIASSRFDPQLGWSTAEEVYQIQFSSNFPLVAVDSDGDAIATWSDEISDTSGDDVIFASRFLPASGWGMATPLSEQQPSIRIEAVTYDSVGDAIVVASQTEQTGLRSVVIRQFSEPDGWSESVNISFERNFVGVTDIATDDQGNVYAIGSAGASFETSDIFVLRRFGDGTWDDPVFLDIADGGELFSDIAASPDGTVIAVWRRFGSQEHSAHVAIFTQETGWTAPELLETPTINDPRDNSFSPISISINSRGDAIAGWSRFEGNTYRAYVNRYE